MILQSFFLSVERSRLSTKSKAEGFESRKPVSRRDHRTLARKLFERHVLKRFAASIVALSSLLSMASAEVMYRSSFETANDIPEVLNGSPDLSNTLVYSGKSLELEAKLTYEQVRVPINTTSSTAYVRFYIKTQNLRNSNYSFTMSMDTPQVRNTTFHGGSNVIQTFPNPRSAGFADASVYKVETLVDFVANTWETKINGQTMGVSAINASGITGIRLNVSPWTGTATGDAPNTKVFIDDLVIADSENAADSTATPQVFYSSGFESAAEIPTVVFGNPQLSSTLVNNGNSLEFEARLSYEQIRIPVNSGSPTLYVRFYAKTQNLRDSNYGFSMIMDTPQVRTTSLHGGLNQIRTFPGDNIQGFSDGTVYLIETFIDFVANKWETKVNGQSIGISPINATSVESIRFSISPTHGSVSSNALNTKVFLDDLLIATAKSGNVGGSNLPYSASFESTSEIPPIVFGNPELSNTLVNSGNSLEFEGRRSYEQVRIPISSDSSTLYVRFFAKTQNLRDSDYAFSMFMDTPEARSTSFHGGLNMVQTFPSPRSVGFADGVVYLVETFVDFGANTWETKINGQSMGTSSIDAQGIDSIRFSMAPWTGAVSGDALDTKVFIDDLLISTSDGAPEIKVTQVGGAELIDGLGVVDFGNVSPGSSQTRVFQVANLGGGPLNLRSLARASGSTWFTVNTSGMATTLAPGQDTTFSISLAAPPSALAGVNSATIRISSNESDEADFDFAVATNVIKPEIMVFGPLFQNIPDSGIVSVGNVELGRTGARRIFTIRNDGGFPLNLNGVTLSGAHSSDFVLDTASMASVVEPSGSTTFSVIFSPSSTGNRSATLLIQNNDFQQAPFDITVNGFGTQPEIEVEDGSGRRLVSDSSVVDLGRVGAGSQGGWHTIAIRNLGLTALNVEDVRIVGPQESEFSVSLVGLDSMLNPNEASTFKVRFEPVESTYRQSVLEIHSDDFDEPVFRILLTGIGATNIAPVVTLLGANPLVVEAAETYVDPGATGFDFEDGNLTAVITSDSVKANRVGVYTVKWTAVDSLSGIATASRTVQVVDTTPPNITPPGDIEVEATDKDGAMVNRPAAVVRDIVGVRSVTYSHFHRSRFPVGSTPVTITATDLAGNVSTASFSVRVLPGRLDQEKPKVRILSPGPKTSFVPATFNISGDVADRFGIRSLAVLLNGEALTLDGGAHFEGNLVPWSVSEARAENGPNIIEVVATDWAGIVGRAVHVVQYYQERPELAGLFSAVLVPEGTPILGRTGLLTVAVREKGTFSGRIIVGGIAHTLRGVLGNDGTARFSPNWDEGIELFAGKGANVRNFGRLSFRVDAGNGISGTLTSGVDALNEMDLATFSGRRAADAVQVPAYLDAVGQTSISLPKFRPYTVVLADSSPGDEPDPDSIPKGDGAASLILYRNGIALIKGYLPDHTPMVSAAWLREDGTIPVYGALYAHKGNASGELAFADLPDSDVSGVNLLWIRPEFSHLAHYAAGWPNGIRLDAVGTFYDPLGSFDLGQGTVDLVNGNAIMQFSDGGLSATIEHLVSFDPVTGRLIRVPIVSKDLLVDFNRKNGWFAGRFRLEDGRLAGFHGVLLNKGANKGGFGYFVVPSSSGFGGGVSLIGNSPD